MSTQDDDDSGTQEIVEQFEEEFYEDQIGEDGQKRRVKKIRKIKRVRKVKKVAKSPTTDKPPEQEKAIAPEPERKRLPAPEPERRRAAPPAPEPERRRAPPVPGPEGRRAAPPVPGSEGRRPAPAAPEPERRRAAPAVPEPERRRAAPAVPEPERRRAAPPAPEPERRKAPAAPAATEPKEEEDAGSKLRPLPAIPDEDRGGDKAVPLSEDVSLLDLMDGRSPEDTERLFKVMGDVNDLQQKITRLSKQNFQQSNDIAALEKKISLLIKNRLTPEEVLPTKNAIMETKDKVAVISDRATAEKYGRILYLLQTQTIYISRLARTVRLAEIENFLQTIMFTLYGNQFDEEEEALLLTMFKNVLFDDFQQATNVSELLRANTPLTRMLATYTRRSSGQQYLKDTLSAVLTELTSDPDLNLEIDPKKVYEAYVNEYEVREGKPFEGERAPLPEVCAAAPFVKERIKRRIPLVADAIRRIIKAISSSLDKVPYGIRYICRQIKLMARGKFPDLDSDSLCSIVSGFFILRYVNPAIVTPNANMLVEQKLSAVHRRNVTIIAKIMQNLANNVEFGGLKEAYMECLNFVLEENGPILNKFVDSLTEVEDLEDRLLDRFAIRKGLSEPTVTISLNEIYFMHQLLVTYKDQIFAGLEHDEVLEIINSFPCVPEQLPRAENGNVELKLIVVSSKDHSQLTTIELEQLYSDFKYYVFKLLTVLQKTNYFETCDRSVKAVPETLAAIEKFGKKQKKDKIYDMAHRANKKLKILLAHEVLSTADNCGRLRSDIAYDLAHVRERAEKLVATKKHLKEVLAQLEKLREEADAQLDLWSAYLGNVRVSATQVKHSTVAGGGSKKDKEKEKEKEAVAKAPVKFTHSQLVKSGVIIECSISDKLVSHVVYEIQPVPDKNGFYQVTPYLSKKRMDTSALTISLEDLLERQSANEVRYETDNLVLHVNMLIRLINKTFL